MEIDARELADIFLGVSPDVDEHVISWDCEALFATSSGYLTGDLTGLAFSTQTSGCKNPRGFLYQDPPEPVSSPKTASDAASVNIFHIAIV